jgi:hypothetical protein
MRQRTTRSGYILRAFRFTILIGTWSALAAVIETTPTLPPPSGFVHATACLLAGCIIESDLGNIAITSSQIVGGNQLIVATGSGNANVFQNNGGVPGAPLGVLTLSGTLSITYVGRSTDTLLGSFPSLLTSFDFMGTFNWHTLVTRLTPGQTSQGLTTITQIPEQKLYLVDSFFRCVRGSQSGWRSLHASTAAPFGRGVHRAGTRKHRPGTALAGRIRGACIEQTQACDLRLSRSRISIRVASRVRLGRSLGCRVGRNSALLVEAGKQEDLRRRFALELEEGCAVISIFSSCSPAAAKRAPARDTGTGMPNSP